MLQLGMAQLGGRLKNVELLVTKQCHLVPTRQEHLDKAMTDNFTHLLTLDDDMSFPADVVERMLVHEKPVMTCNYRRKRPDRLEHCCTQMDGTMLDSTGKTGLEQIKAMGMGCTLIEVDALRHIPKPHFGTTWNYDMQEYLMEDSWFSLLLLLHGVPIFVDHDLSREIGHVGEVQYRLPPLPVSQVGEKEIEYPRPEDRIAAE